MGVLDHRYTLLLKLKGYSYWEAVIVDKFSTIVPYLYLQFTHSAAAEAFKLRLWDADRVNDPIGMASDTDGCQKSRQGPILSIFRCIQLNQVKSE